MPGALTARNQHWLALFLLIFVWDDLIIAILFSGSVAGTVGAYREEWSRSGGWIEAALTAAGTLMALWLLVDRQPKLRIDFRGILWPPWSSEPIPWSAIRAVEIAYGVGQSSFDVVLADPAVAPPRRGWRVRHGWLRPNRPGVVRIAPGGGLDQDIDAMIDAIDHFRPGLIQRVE
ncbi:MAG TPA: hypothetical protein VGW34_15130 [Allosphingosinicella sp.]|nr:hypothetical protein [Allosphingosinicella sp.]